jgi:hypothetical protein
MNYVCNRYPRKCETSVEVNFSYKVEQHDECTTSVFSSQFNGDN